MKHTRSVRRAVAALVAAGLVAVPLSVTGAADAKPTRPPGKPVTCRPAGPLDLGHVGDADATTTDDDCLATLLDELAARGAEYVPVSIAPRADVVTRSASTGAA